MLREGRIRNGRASLRGVVLNREHIPLWQYLVLLPVYTLWLFVGFAVLPPLDGWVKGTFFSWWPRWLDTTAPIGNLPPALVVVMVVGIALTGLAAPIVEEMYFRGYLLPRMSYLKGWAPLLNVVLFALYHLFTLWLAPTRIITLLPIVYAVWWKKNIYLSIVPHCVLNTVGLLILIFTVFR
jgi:membrane protease YdiL (CAAX protease family)